jgi:hypothetical protein
MVDLSFQYGPPQAIGRFQLFSCLKLSNKHASITNMRQHDINPLCCRNSGHMLYDPSMVKKRCHFRVSSEQ